MRTRFKVEQAHYFLALMEKTLDYPKENGFCLSAFAASWNSVFDAMLMDMAIISGIYEHIVKKSHGKTPVINSNSFLYAAEEMNNLQAEEFLGWWVDKIGRRNNSTTNEIRDSDVHLGFFMHETL
jgi:hypothetical protein